MESFMNTKIQRVISETVFDPSVKEHRNQLTVFFDDGESIKYDFYQLKSLRNSLDNIIEIQEFSEYFRCDVKNLVSFMFSVYTACHNVFSNFDKSFLYSYEYGAYQVTHKNYSLDVFMSECRGELGFGLTYHISPIGIDHNNVVAGDSNFYSYMTYTVEGMEQSIRTDIHYTFKRMIEGMEKGTNNNDIKSEKS